MPPAQPDRDATYEETRKRLAESQSLQRVTSSLLQKTSLAEVLEIVCTEAQQLTGAAGSTVLLLEDDDWLTITQARGVPISSSDRLPVDGSLSGKAIRLGQPLLINDPASQIQGVYANPEVTALLAVPLRTNEAVIGILDVVNKPTGFTEDDIRLVNLFADQAAIAIEKSQMLKRIERLAVLEERQRLARELHDSVAQALYSATMYAEAARLALEAGKHGVVAQNLQELRGMVREAQVDMRVLIFELHPPVLKEEGLVAALQARLAAVEARTGLRAEMEVDGDRRLPLAVEEELYWIAQEALNNVIKHAQAQHVTVRLDLAAGQVCLEVEDDGVGLSPEQPKEAGGLGLRGIEQRVRRIRGELSVVSSPGEGTRLHVTAAC
jgi:signal transduction histidine kinase